MVLVRIFFPAALQVIPRSHIPASSTNTEKVHTVQGYSSTWPHQGFQLDLSDVKKQ